MSSSTSANCMASPTHPHPPKSCPLVCSHPNPSPNPLSNSLPLRPPQTERMHELRAQAREQAIEQVAPFYKKMRALALRLRPCPVRARARATGTAASERSSTGQEEVVGVWEKAAHAGLPTHVVSRWL